MENLLKKLNFKNHNHLKLIRQIEISECGLACLGMISSYYGGNWTISELRNKFPISSKGLTLNNLFLIANEMNLVARPLRLTLNELTQLKTPSILHWELNHFVVLSKVTNKHFIILDPSRGKREIPIEEVSQAFTGVAIEFTPTKYFKPKPPATHIKIRDFWSSLKNLKPLLIQLFLLSFVLQLFSLMSPLYLQIVVDKILSSNDSSLLAIISIGFFILKIFNIFISTLRSFILLHFGTKLSVQIAGNLFNHLLKLPLQFFETRTLGDIISRFSSLDEVKRLLTTGLITVVIDGILSISTIFMMFYFNTLLSLIVVFVVILYSLVRFLSYPLLREYYESQIILNARESTNFMETIRSMQSIKIFAKELQRQSLWHNHYANSVNNSIRTQKLTTYISAINSFIFSLENILIIYFGATLIINEELTIGMLYAFIAYKSQFIARTSSLILKAIEYTMLKMHIERISDIALASPEQPHSHSLNNTPLSGFIELSDLSFSYPGSNECIFQNINFSVSKGESIAIIGDSGAGKTTLLKVMLGLFQPTSGKILDSGSDIFASGLQNFRSQTASVMQDDQLLAGSLTDNISFFDENVDHDKVIECAKFSEIHEDIIKMPMTYHSLIGEMGTTLSGGQKQRVLLARALYKNPKILFLDEATSHLDKTIESKINQSIKSLKITRIIIAHRLETILSADRVIKLTKNQLIDQTIQYAFKKLQEPEYIDRPNFILD